MYLDGLLEELSNSGVGCYWGFLFVGALAYADDIVLLAPCASALRCMLSICNNFATEHELTFNPNKTQLICFRRFNQPSCNSFPECNTEIHGCSETSWSYPALQT